MRAFVIVGHRAVTAPTFTLKDLPGSGGRLDILLRSLNASLFLSHSIRRDVRTYLVLLGPPNAPRTIRFDGASLQHANPDERSLAILVEKALKTLVTGHYWQTSTPGVAISARGLEDLDDELKGLTPTLLEEGGADAFTHPWPSDVAVYVGDHEGFTESELAHIEKVREAPRVSVGPRALHADHAITIAQNALDRAAAASASGTSPTQ